MTKIISMGTLALVILIGGIAYLGIAGAAIIYCLGGNESPINHRIIFGILGAVMFYAFVCMCIYLAKHGWPL